MQSVPRGFAAQLSKEERKKLIDEIISFYITEREEEVDIIASNEILDFFLDSIGPYIYNKAVEDTRKLIKEELESVDFKIEMLKK